MAGSVDTGQPHLAMFDQIKELVDHSRDLRDELYNLQSWLRPSTIPPQIAEATILEKQSPEEFLKQVSENIIASQTHTEVICKILGGESAKCPRA